MLGLGRVEDKTVGKRSGNISLGSHTDLNWYEPVMKLHPGI